MSVTYIERASSEEKGTSIENGKGTEIKTGRSLFRSVLSPEDTDAPQDPPARLAPCGVLESPCPLTADEMQARATSRPFFSTGLLLTIGFRFP